MARIANEMHLSETVFLLPAESGGDARVRIFTPQSELPFAGHPVAGAAWVIARTVALGRITLETGMGLVPVEVERLDGALSRVVMTQPRPEFTLARDPDAILAALAPHAPAPGEGVEIGDNGVRVALIPAKSRRSLASLRPDLGALARSEEAQTICVWSLDGSDVHARVFAPAVGVNEDPATGSAAGPLGALLVRRGLLPPGSLRVFQGAELGRPSVIDVEIGMEGDVRVGGACVVVGRGFLEL
jgi:trans-2,3-dihydro-3-hydroxyanthranilate isomerase